MDREDDVPAKDEARDEPRDEPREQGWTKRKWAGLDNFKCDDCIYDCFEVVDMVAHREEVHGPNAPKVPGPQPS